MPLKGLSRKLYGNGKRLKGLGKSSRGPTLPPILLAKNQAGAEEPGVADIMAVMGNKPHDLNLARKVAKLKKKLPQGTVPELITYVWLTEHGIDFDYQVEAEGGRKHTGGSVIDFLVRPGKVWAWRIQGVYFHNLPQQKIVDEIRRKLLEGATVLGYQLDGVVDLWEPRIYKDREEVFTLGLAGIEMGD